MRVWRRGSSNRKYAIQQKTNSMTSEMIRVVAASIANIMHNMITVSIMSKRKTKQ